MNIINCRSRAAIYFITSVRLSHEKEVVNLTCSDVIQKKETKEKKEVNTNDDRKNNSLTRLQNTFDTMQ